MSQFLEVVMSHKDSPAEKILPILSHNLKLKKDEPLYQIYHHALTRLQLTTTDYLTIIDLLKMEQQGQELHIILILLFQAFAEGSLCISMEKKSLMATIERLGFETDCEDWLDQFFNNIRQNVYQNCLVAVDSCVKSNQQYDYYKPIIYYNNKKEKYLYFHKYFFSALQVKDNILQRIIAEDHQKNFFKTWQWLENEELKLSSFTLNPEQKLAIALCLTRKTCIISGGPGTGKTTIASRIVYYFLKTKKIQCTDIILSAPTGKAAQKLYETVVMQIDELVDDSIDWQPDLIRSSTLHTLLKYNTRKNHFHYNRTNQLSAQLILVDEVSMIDVSMMSLFLQAIASDTVLLFLGDKNQLPSVDAGAVLSDLLSDTEPLYSRDILTAVAKTYPKLSQLKLGENHAAVDRIALLQTINRQKENDIRKNSIIKISQNIINGIYPKAIEVITTGKITSFLLEEHTGVYRMAPTRIDQWKVILKLIFQNYFHNTLKEIQAFTQRVGSIDMLGSQENRKLKRFFSDLMRIKILGLIKNGVYGVNYINQFFEALVGGVGGRHRGNFIEGLPVMITRNQPDLSLFNGNQGILLQIGQTRYFVIDRGASFEFIALGRIIHYETSFAMTVHKSQGSEYRDVFMVFPQDLQLNLLSREIVYTGITRAKKMVVLFTNDELLQKAVETSIHRETGIKIWQ